MLIDPGLDDRSRVNIYIPGENTTTDILPYNLEACGCRYSQWQKIVLLNSDILVKYLCETKIEIS